MNNCIYKDRCKGNCPNTDMCIRKYKLDYIYRESLISDNQRKHRNLVLDADKSDLQQFKILKNIEDDIVNFVKNGDNLYIHSSNAGNGKTSWALRMIERYFDSIADYTALTCRALFISVPKFLVSLKENISDKNDYIQHIKANILKADIVIWDDIATKNSTTQFESEYLLNYIDNRIALGKTNIYTSNLNDKELETVLGYRLASRITESYNIELKGADKRRLKYE